jgi:hypothetical protein
MGCSPDQLRARPQRCRADAVAATTQRVLLRNGLIDPQAQQHKRKDRRWQH